MRPEAEFKRKIRYRVVPFYISFDDKNYQKEVEEIAIDDVYRKMVDFPKQYPKTSLPSVQNYVDAFTLHVKEGRAVICVCITTSLRVHTIQRAMQKRLFVKNIPMQRLRY